MAKKVETDKKHGYSSLNSNLSPQLTCMPIFRILFLLFLSIPILEIYLLLEVSDSIGPLPTVALVVLTAVVGVWLIRLQGFATLAKAQQSLAQGEMPATTMFEGILLFIAGALLLTPGFFTDSIGFLFLIPVSRQWIVRTVLKKAIANSSQFNAHFQQSSSKTGNTYQSSSTEVIEGEFISHDDKK